MVFDSTYVWVADRESEMVAKFKASDRKLLTEAPMGTGSDPVGSEANAYDRT